MNQKWESQCLEASLFPVSPTQTLKGPQRDPQNAGQPPDVSVRLQIKFCEFLKGIWGDKVDSEELGVVGCLFPSMKHILRGKNLYLNVS